MSTKIDWCDEVWNPTTGCTKGCPYCYARPFAKRMKNHPNEKIADTYQRGFWPTCHAERLDMPMKWKKPRRIFVDSMGDLFDPGIPTGFISEVVATISLQERHTFMVLTKQPARMLEFFNAVYFSFQPPGKREYINNLWLGVSVTNQAEANEYISLLLQIPAKLRFISVEPMQGPVHIPKIKRTLLKPSGHFPGYECTGDGGYSVGIDWVICGGMTGQKATAPEYEWVTDLRDQCAIAEVPFYFKGWGKHLPGAQIDGREWREFPK